MRSTVRFGLAAGILSLAIPSAQSQIEGNPPSLTIINWTVVRFDGDIVVYDRDIPIGTRASIAAFDHTENDFVSVTVDVTDPDWIADITFDPMTGEEQNSNEEVWLRFRAFSRLQFSPPSPPQIGINPEGWFPEEEGFRPIPGPTTPYHFFYTFELFQIPQFIGVNQRRLRGEIDFDVSYRIELCAGNDKEDEALQGCTNQNIFVIENPALRPENPQASADAGADRTVLINAPVVLDASRTFDAYNNGFDVNDPNVFDKDRLEFAWEMISGPAPVTFAQDTPNDPTAEVTLQVPGVYEFRVLVDDNASSALPTNDTVIITAAETLPPQNPPVALAAHPAGPVQLGALITLDARQSFDPDGDPLTFRWRQTNALGDPLESIDLIETFQPLSGVDSSVSTWRAIAPGTYYFRLVVSDGTFQVATDLITVQVITTLTGGRTEASGEPVVRDPSGAPTGSADTADGSDDTNAATAALGLGSLCGAGLAPLAAVPLALFFLRRRMR